MLANLDNEVIFKKAFTDKLVLQRFVKDLFGIDFIPDNIETEKRFKPKIAHIDFKYDVFAESKDKRIVVEIQKIDYDYNFDRFLLYHNMAVAELQRNSKEYKADKTVYTIVVCTEKYISKTKEEEEIDDDILVHNSNLFNLENQERNVFGHKLIFLNHNYIKDSTPKGFRDWLELVQQSIKNPENPQVNLDNEGVKKVVEIIDYEQLTPEELREAKNRHATESSKEAYWNNAIYEGSKTIARKLIAQKVLTLEQIAEITSLPISVVKKL
jgi:PD-(D/E)XK nuclease family transposase